MKDTVLITGVTGFIGMEVLARYLERTDRPIYTLVRARDEDEARARLRSTMDCLFGDEDAYEDRVTALRGDIEQPRLGLDRAAREAVARQVSDIVHAAASVSFTLPFDQSRKINVEGTRRMLELAQLCERRGGLERFCYISTAYVAGTHTGEFTEDQLDIGQRFRNPYEQSKFEAERLVRDHDGLLPIQIFRPSIVVGEAATGWTPAFNVLYTPLKAYVRGSLQAIPARRGAPVDVVPVDYVADAVFELAQDPVARTVTYHLVAGPSATTVGRIMELAVETVGRRPPVVLPPRLFRHAVYPVLVRTSPRREGLKRTNAFFPYFAMDVRYDNSRARARLTRAQIEVPRLESYFRRLIDFADCARWGRTPVTRAQAQRLVANAGAARERRGLPLAASHA